MTYLGALFAAVGAAVGAVCRYVIGRYIQERSEHQFPWATWVINMSGTLLLGVFYQYFVVAHAHPIWWLLLGTGFCGGFTTFSTMSHEAFELFRKQPMLAIGYLGSSFGCGLLLAFFTQWL